MTLLREAGVGGGQGKCHSVMSWSEGLSCSGRKVRKSVHMWGFDMAECSILCASDVLRTPQIYQTQNSYFPL